jgi:hypothetical protein
MALCFMVQFLKVPTAALLYLLLSVYVLLFLHLASLQCNLCSEMSFRNLSDP